MRNGKRLFSILLCCALALSLLPWAATSARALEKPAQPEFETCTEKSITLKTVTPPAGCTVEYGVTDSSSHDPAECARWQTEPTFTQGEGGNDLKADWFYYFYVRYRQGEEIGEPSERKALKLPYLAPNLPFHYESGISYLGTFDKNYAVYDAEKGRMTASWNTDSRTLTLDGFVGAEGQGLYLSGACTVLLKGENVFDMGTGSSSLSISSGTDVVIRGADEGARLAVRGMFVQTNRLSIENCTLDVSWITRNSTCYCADMRCSELALTDARLLCPAPPEPPAGKDISILAFDMESCKTDCKIALTRSTLRVAAPTAEDETLSEDCIRHCGKETSDPAEISLLALTLNERSAVELNGDDTFYTQYGKIAVSTDLTSSAVFHGTVYVNTFYSVGDMSLGGNITVDTQEGNSIQADGALNITAPGVTLTTPEGYYFSGYNPAEGVVAVPSFSVYCDPDPYYDYSYFVNDADGKQLTGTVRFLGTKECAVSVVVDGGKGGTVSGAGTFREGEVVTLTATPDAGYVFDHWKRADGTTSTDRSLTFMVAEAETVTAYFRRVTYTVSVGADPAGDGTVTLKDKDGKTVGSGSIAVGTQLTAAASAKTGYVFSYWTDNGRTVASDAGKTGTVTVTVNADHKLVAHFAPYSVADGKVCAPGGALLVLAQYQDGRMSAVQSVKLAADYANADAKTLLGIGAYPDGSKLMLVDGSTYVPLCAAWEKQ